MDHHPPEPRRDPRYPSKHDDPVWRQWQRESTTPRPAPPGRPAVDGRSGATPQTSVRLPDELPVLDVAEAYADGDAGVEAEDE